MLKTVQKNSIIVNIYTRVHVETGAVYNDLAVNLVIQEFMYSSHVKLAPQRNMLQIINFSCFFMVFFLEYTM